MSDKPMCRIAWRLLNGALSKDHAAWCVDQLFAIADARVNGKPIDHDRELAMANGLAYVAAQLKRMADQLVEDLMKERRER